MWKWENVMQCYSQETVWAENGCDFDHSLQNNSGNGDNKTYVLCPTLQTRTCIGVLKSNIIYVLSFIHCHRICVYIVFSLLIARLMRLAIILPAEVSWKRNKMKDFSQRLRSQPLWCSGWVYSRVEPKVQGSSPLHYIFFLSVFFCFLCYCFL